MGKQGRGRERVTGLLDDVAKERRGKERKGKNRRKVSPHCSIAGNIGVTQSKILVSSWGFGFGLLDGSTYILTNSKRYISRQEQGEGRERGLLT